MILAIDPGSKVIGWAAIFGTTLKACGLLRPKTLSETMTLAEGLLPMLGSNAGERHVIIEEPQAYIQRLQKGDQNDLIHIALVGGIVAGSVGAFDVRVVKPREWKGQVDPDVMLKRIMKRLNPAETALVEAVKPASLLHNCQDAVGLGLWAVGRLGVQ